MTDNKDNAALRERPVQPEVRLAVGDKCPECGHVLEFDSGEPMSFHSPGQPPSVFCGECGFQNYDFKITERVSIKIKNLKIGEDEKGEWIAYCDLIIDDMPFRQYATNLIGYKAVADMFQSVTDTIREYYSDVEY